jgi:peptide/nickel transport system permease protein
MSTRLRIGAAVCAPAVLAGLAFAVFGHASPLDDPLHAPDRAHWLGTDPLGRDVANELASAARLSVSAAAGGAAGAVLAGTVAGAVAGLSGRRVDRAANIVADAVASVPLVLLLIGVALALGPGWATVPVSVAVVAWPGVFRTVRAETIRLRRCDFVRASRAMGAGTSHVVRWHVLPHLAPVVAASAAAIGAWAVHVEAVLGYLGLGPEGVPSWGRMLAQAPALLERGAWWEPLGAAAAISCTALGLQLLADALADASRPAPE